ncbi:hypothetical protein X798_02814 [Onchocerca flexuosa]|uniref:Uncharacterized protein n=1 Tax=Onchocerca flexuosa TaxID=387005 RepID=A0A238BYQ0_9BILA|nr:hypothetical protein X798_02814 [Onchocerca flexuosa]
MITTSDRCCCGLLHIKHGTITVGSCSLLSTLINTVLFLFGINRTSHHFYIELCLILIDIFSILSLFYGVLHMRPNFLKPCVYFTVSNICHSFPVFKTFQSLKLAWCVALGLLFIFSLVELINGDKFPANVAISVADIFNVAQSDDMLRNPNAMLTILSLIGLLLSIAFNIWFLRVIFDCYQWLIIQESKPLNRNNHHVLAPQLLSFSEL